MNPIEQELESLVRVAECISPPTLHMWKPPTVLTKVTQTLLGELELVYLQGHCEEHSRHKVTQICSKLDFSLELGPSEVTEAWSGLVIWEEFDPVTPEEVDRVCKAASLVAVGEIHVLPSGPRPPKL